MLRYEPIIERYLDVTGRSGDEFYSKCPFHNDTTPSFSINGKTGLWICHGCGAKGNIDHFTSALGISINTTVSQIRNRVEELRAVEVEDSVPEKLKVYPEAWLSQFRHPTSYWEMERGIGSVTQDAFGLGYDPFWNAVTIPLRNESGSLLGVVRRRLDEHGPKYVYPRGFRASDNLFASWKIKGHTTVAIVEGPIDALACWEAGIPALALYGSHMSQRQLALLMKLNITEIVIMTDNDEAGIRAAAQIVDDLKGIGWRYPTEWPNGVKDPGDMDEETLWVTFNSATHNWHLN